jgi:hypothetical protein
MLLQVRRGKLKGGLKLNVNDFENFVFLAKFQSSSALLRNFLRCWQQEAISPMQNVLIFSLSCPQEQSYSSLPVEGMFDFDGFSGGTLKFP